MANLAAIAKYESITVYKNEMTATNTYFDISVVTSNMDIFFPTGLKGGTTFSTEILIK